MSPWWGRQQGTAASTATAAGRALFTYKNQVKGQLFGGFCFTKGEESEGRFSPSQRSTDNSNHPSRSGGPCQAGELPKQLGTAAAAHVR